jgi:uncharacterized protein YqjF (DUF2071 family)
MSADRPSTAKRFQARERPLGFPVMRQTWSNLLFLHWPVNPEILASRLPPGLRVDTFDGKAWLGVVPFFMDRVRPSLLPPIPWLSWFMELNVRTYVYDANGNPGVWFFSLECNQPLAVELARRFFHLPYQHSEMRHQPGGDRIAYYSRRRTPGAACAEFSYQPNPNGSPAAEDSLEWFLVERYLLFSADSKGRLYCGKVHHRPYRISPAVCESWSTAPLALDGFIEPTDPPASMLAAAPVDVEIFPLRRSG